MTSSATAEGPGQGTGDPTVSGPRSTSAADNLNWQAWAGGLALLAVGLIGLGYLLLIPSDEQRQEAIVQAFAEKRWSDVELGLKAWLRDHPRDSNAWEMLGGVLYDQGRLREAAAAIEHIDERETAWVHARTVLGQIALDEHNLPEAVRILERVSARHSRAVEALKLLASTRMLVGRSYEARVLLHRVFRLTHDPRDLAESMLTAQGESDVRSLKPEIEEFVRKTPDDPWLRRVWGLFLNSRDRWPEALPHLEAAAALFDTDPIGRFALAECRLALGIKRGDLSILGPPPKRAVDAARWWILRGRLAEVWELNDEATRSFDEASSADPSNAEAHHRLGQAMIRRGQRQAGQEHLRRAEELGILADKLRPLLRRAAREPLDTEALVAIGRLCEELGMLAEARDWFEIALARDPLHRSFGIDLKQLPVVDGEPSVALSCPVLKATPAPGKLTSSAPVQPATSRLRFEEAAHRMGVDYQYNCGATPRMFIGDTMGGGVALFDFDEDGWLDIYFVNGCKLPFDPQSPPRPNRLYRNRGDGSFEDVTARAGVAGRGYGMGCVVGDYDNDGHDDLFLTGLNQTVLYRNRGDGTFEDVTAKAGVSSSRWTTAAGFGDLDSDGDLDLMVVTYVQADAELEVECHDRSGRLIHCQPAQFQAQFDHLFRNNGDGSFTDISREAGIELPEGRGLGLAVADFDGDARLDLFVANDGTANFLFRNRGDLSFEEIGQAAAVGYDGSGQPTASMGVVAEDLNGDSLIDLFHTNFINQGSTLRLNLGGDLFADGTLAAGLATPSRARTGFGAVALDVDNDGILELFVANGHTDDQPWFDTPMAQTPQLYKGRERGRFEMAGIEVSPYFAHPVVGRGVACGDLDNDGRLDLVVVHRDAPAALLRNCTLAGHWLAIRLRGNKSGRTPVGARVICRAGQRTQVRWVTSGTGYLSASDPRLWFGLGPAEKVDELEVRWPSGVVQSWSDVPADQRLELTEGDDSMRGAVQRGANRNQPTDRLP